MPITPPEIAPPDEAHQLLQHLLDATQAGDYEAFLAPGTERFQKGIAKSMFHGVSEQVASRLRAGFTTDYLAELKQGEIRVYLWKMSFRDRGCEYVARLSLTADGKVAGFLLN